ncbi:MAG: flagellar motor protein MotA [Gammaproteobacteria bacterium]|jgi:chemotaxis protein MotA|nr:flagellar motor protein MotA [Gammaproteobacteria bacterium]
MSIGTIVGILVGFGLFLWAIFANTDNPAIFLSLSSLAMVGGGAIAGSYMSYQPLYVNRAFKALITQFQPSTVTFFTLLADVERMIGWAKTVQTQGVVALEQEMGSDTTDSFLAVGGKFVLSNYKGDELRELLETANASSFQRNTLQVGVLKKMATLSPAYGMIGTLVGLVIMLGNMGGDPAALGAGMAVAMLTTLYGVVFAQMVFLPAAEKLQQKEEMVRFRNTLLVEGFMMLADQRPGREIQDRLNSYLAPAAWFDVAE